MFYHPFSNKLCNNFSKKKLVSNNYAPLCITDNVINRRRINSIRLETSSENILKYSQHKLKNKEFYFMMDQSSDEDDMHTCQPDKFNSNEDVLGLHSDVLGKIIFVYY